jgi:hypothetical protein
VRLRRYEQSAGKPIVGLHLDASALPSGDRLAAEVMQG